MTASDKSSDAEADHSFEPPHMRGPALYWMIFVLVLIQIIDGLDMLSLAFVGPAISNELNLGRAQLGACIGIVFLGTAFGAMCLGWLAGRWGKKRTLISVVISIGPAALMTTQVGSVSALFVLRLLMGFAIGGVFPIAAAMLIDKAPAAIRLTAVSVMALGGACGAGACGLVATFIVPMFGWRSMFVVTGLLPFVLLPAIYFLIPRDRLDTADQGLNGYEKMPAKAIVGKRLLPASILIWSASFFCALPVYFAVSWLPTLAKTAGSTYAEAALAASLFTAVGAIGGVLSGQLVDRYGFRVTPMLAGLGTVAMAVLGGAIGSHLIATASAVTGLLSLGLLTLAGAVAGQLYPPAIRAFGVGCGTAIMRLGATTGPWVGGIALDAGASNKLLFTIAGVFVLIGGASLWALGSISEHVNLRPLAPPK